MHRGQMATRFVVCLLMLWCQASKGQAPAAAQAKRKLIEATVEKFMAIVEDGS